MPRFLAGLDPAVKAAIVTSLTTAIAGVIGFVILIWRLRREAQRAIDEIKSTEAMKLKLKIYEREVIKTVDLITDAGTALSGFARRFTSDLTIHKRGTEAGLPTIPPVARAPVLMELKASFDRAAIEIVAFTERWSVIDPRFEVFRIAINAALYDVNAEYAPYFDLVIRGMPMDLPAGLRWAPPTNEVLGAINATSDALLGRLVTMIAYTSDFLSEMQNTLVGPLFGNTSSRRQPIDPQHVVISLDNEAWLTRHFLENTAWGRTSGETEARIRAGLDHRPCD